MRGGESATIWTGEGARMNHSIRSLLTQVKRLRKGKKRSNRQPPRPRAPEVKKPQNDLAAKQKAAMEALRNRREIENQSKPQPAKQEISKPSINHLHSQNLLLNPKSRSHRRGKTALLICVQSRLLLLNLLKKHRMQRKQLKSNLNR